MGRAWREWGVRVPVWGCSVPVRAYGRLGRAAMRPCRRVLGSHCAAGAARGAARSAGTCVGSLQGSGVGGPQGFDLRLR